MLCMLLFDTCFQPVPDSTIKVKQTNKTKTKKKKKKKKDSF